ncbi:S8 family serine peptidase [Lentzea sp. PSKA42]|uniref:S8 family serine peptidase n=1 Tax=Lentzea indica TaxID=2604800 RepID=A0ABX1FXY8_9PSEU|nr:S8 family serine peptidase [Lentzea indica]NKE63316.1 S8 family serine peptidase [Lentzea indica]
MTIYWPDSQLHAAAEVDDTGLALQVPEEVLQRHGARVLRPTDAVEGAAGPAVQPTAYVASVLLMPDELLDTRLTDLNGRLQQTRMVIDIERVARDPNLPVASVVLRASGPEPVAVDAWIALQAIRADESLGRDVSLEHLMFASGLPGDLGGVPGAIQGFAPPFGPAGPVPSGYLDGPVALEMQPICQKDPATLKLRRQPVVAVLDTGIGRNTWLDIKALDTTQTMSTWDTGYVQVDPKIQLLVEQAGVQLDKQGHRVEIIRHAKDEPLTRNPLIGTQDWCFGHGEFCAGIIQQIAPDATVLAIRVMGSDGIARESAVVAALKGLVDRVTDALTTGDMKKMVDVVSLSMGYPFERPQADEKTSPIAKQIDALRALGVLVVAAAGNSASTQRFFPACLSTHTNALHTPPVISVGALNPNGSKALFTNETPTCYATGVNVISTFPQDANASRQPLLQVPATNRAGLPQFRQSPDVDDHTLSPFAVWTGTSFAAPHIAGHLAKALQDMETHDVAVASHQDQAKTRAAEAVNVVKTNAK